MRAYDFAELTEEQDLTEDYDGPLCLPPDLMHMTFEADTLMICNPRVGLRPSRSIACEGCIDAESADIENCWGLSTPPEGYVPWFALWSNIDGHQYDPDEYPMELRDLAIIHYPKDAKQGKKIEVLYQSQALSYLFAGDYIRVPWVHGVRGLAAGLLEPLRFLELLLTYGDLEEVSKNAILHALFYSGYLRRNHPAFTSKPSPHFYTPAFD
jgi:hypothetical protein